MYIRNSFVLLLLSVGATQARELVVVNATNQDVRGRIKVQLIGDKATKKGSVHFEVAKGASVTCDLTTAEKWVRSTTEIDPEKPRKGKKLERKAIAPDVGAIGHINLVKIKAKNASKIKGRAKILSAKKGILREDLVSASRIVITQEADKLVFTAPLS